MSSITVLVQKFIVIWPLLNERTRRLTAANEAMQLGYGGVCLVHRACGLSRKAIVKGMGEIEAGRLLAGRNASVARGLDARTSRCWMAGLRVRWMK